MQTGNLINGEFVQAASGNTVTVFNPADDMPVAEVPDSGEGEIARAIDAASEAFPKWSATPAIERAGLLRRWAGFMLRDSERLAALMTAEQGKPLAEAEGEIKYAASFLTDAAAQAETLSGSVVPSPKQDMRITAIRQPVGVCAAITPWNFPSAMLARKLGPALASGCTMLAKPAHETPLSAIAMAELGVEAGLPKGVFNIVTCDAKLFSATIFGDRRVRKVSFTGSTPVGRTLMKQGAENLVRLSLELGGHAPFLIFEDADLDAAAEGLIVSKFRNAGQTCICPNRLYIQASVYDEAMDRLRKKIEKLKVGPGDVEGVQIGPLINDKAIKKVDRHIADAKQHGAEVLCGGERAKPQAKDRTLADRFYAPTLLSGLKPAMAMAKEETFGPVIAAAPFDTEAEAIGLANSTPYGLASYFYTRDHSRAIRVAEAIRAGIVGVNSGGVSTAQAPFGGVGLSGYGREGGPWALDEYTDVKYISTGVAER
ncbi:MAG: NAD-dependent succinate-semialdehyde dehydrogenase [Phycisphaerales bacterium]|nr:NAD-dependent succinate-semialdehyde dehydrogenase [Phycisphaerales bacterium]